jgi:hypothetical protein
MNNQMPISLVGAALRYAALGWAVFPLHFPIRGGCSCGPDCSSPGKHPYKDIGFKLATILLFMIVRWWQWRPNANVGIHVGDSGLVVVDIDPRHGGRVDSLPLSEADRITPTVITGGGGLHLYYRAPIGLNISNSNQLLPPGIDVRAGVSYVVAPPSEHESGRRYAWLLDRAPWEVRLLPLPAALVPMLKIRDWPVQKRKDSSPVSPMPVAQATRHPYVQSALQRELNKLIHSPQGRRNITLNEVAFNLGQFVQADLLDRSEVEALLTKIALSIGLGERETLATINSGLRAGTANPRQNWPEW